MPFPGPKNDFFPDGRRLIDGKAEKEVSGVQLWHEVIKKRTLTPVFAIPGVDATELEEEEEVVATGMSTSNEPKYSLTVAAAVTVAETEPVVAASPKRQTELDRSDEKK